MYLKELAAVAVAAVFALVPATADASCCDQKNHQSHQAACCQSHQATCCQDKTADNTPVFPIETDPQLLPAAPVRQVAEVWFHRPVLVGKSILQGRYVIEHDNDRMARGEPCTHIYAYGDRTTPVAAFHCTHLERDRADQNLVVLVTTADGSMQRLTEFQFAGESAAHGYPTGR